MPVSEYRVLSPEECYHLLATQEVGRLGVVVDGHPFVLPVNFALDGRIVLLRTSPGTKLRATDRAEVTFEVDQLDPFRLAGWSVVVRGVAEHLDRTGDDDDLPGTPGPRPWAPGERAHWVRIVPREVTGRLVAAARPDDPEPVGYL